MCVCKDGYIEKDADSFSCVKKPGRVFHIYSPLRICTVGSLHPPTGLDTLYFKLRYRLQVSSLPGYVLCYKVT